MKFEGIYTPAVTPFGPDNEIDRKAFAEVLESLIEAKVHGIIIGGSTGEYYAQTAQERFELAAYAKDVLGGRLPLIVGTGATRTEDAIEYAKAAKSIGADAILVTTPPYALPTDQENAVHALAIDRAADLPIMLYNYPARMGVTMGEEYLARVGKSKNVVAIKESSGDMSRVHLLAREFPHISLSCGWDDQALEFFAWGARSWVCAGSNFLPSGACGALRGLRPGKELRQRPQDHDSDAAADALPGRRQIRAVDQVRLRVERPQRRPGAGPAAPPQLGRTTNLSDGHCQPEARRRADYIGSKQCMIF